MKKRWIFLIIVCAEILPLFALLLYFCAGSIYSKAFVTTRIVALGDLRIHGHYYHDVVDDLGDMVMCMGFNTENREHTDTSYLYDDYPKHLYDDTQEAVWSGGIYAVDEHYVCSTFRRDDHGAADQHVLDQLLYLNEETKRAELIYETTDGDRILYANHDMVVIYRYNTGIVQYLSLADDTVLSETPIELKKGYEYSFEVNQAEQCIEVHRYIAYGYPTSFSFNIPLTGN